MEYTRSRKIDFIKSILDLLLVLVFVGMALFPRSGIHYELGLGLFGGFRLLYVGIKKVVEAHRHQQHIYWYKEPGILYGFAVLLGALPFLLMEAFLSNSVPNASIIKDKNQGLTNPTTSCILNSNEGIEHPGKAAIVTSM